MNSRYFEAIHCTKEKPTTPSFLFNVYFVGNTGRGVFSPQWSFGGSGGLNDVLAAENKQNHAVTDNIHKRITVFRIKGDHTWWESVTKGEFHSEKMKTLCEETVNYTVMHIKLEFDPTRKSWHLSSNTQKVSRGKQSKLGLDKTHNWRKPLPVRK